VPDRMIREGFIYSPNVNALSDRAECAWARLLVKVDDYGVYYAEPKLVRAAIWPTKSYRDADVVRVLDEIERARLIARFTASDGVRYLCLLRFRQRLAYGLRRRYPAPPFDEDSGEMRLELVGEPPPVVAPKKRKEEKRRESVREAPAALPAPILSETVAQAPATPSVESHEAWLARLQVAWPHLDVRAEAVKAYLKKTKRGEQLERGWFEANWLKNCTETVTNKALFAPKAAVGVMQGEPDGWRDVLEGTVLGDAVEAGEIGGWDDLNKTQRDFVHQRLVEMRRAAS
jgi:hypothetical protein